MLNLESFNSQLLIALSVFSAIFLFGYSLLVSLLCLVAIGTCVFFLVINFLNDNDSRLKLTNFVVESLKLQTVSNEESKQILEAKKSFQFFTQDFPWNGVTLPKQLNSALERFANSLIEDYINRWYKAEISADNTFLLEIKYQIRFGSATAVRALRNYDFAQLIQQELLPLVILHVHRVYQLLDSADEGSVSVDDQLTTTFADDLHVAMNSHENSESYLSEIADHLVALLMDDSRIGGREMDSEAPTTYKTTSWPSEACRHFLRQLVLSTILTPILDFITNPDTLNRLIITALNPNRETLEDVSKDKRVPFLQNLSKYCEANVPDSFFALKLSDLIRDPRLLQIFDNYLRDIHGPTYWLDCFLQTNDVLHRLQTIKGSESADFDEVFSDVWQLYSAFVHRSAKTQVKLFSEELFESFSNAITDRSYAGLLKSVEEVYMILYHEINYTYVVSFCQSESYLGYLCGTSATAVELFQDEEQEHVRAEDDRFMGLSITQIPTKIWNVLRGDFGEEMEEQLKEAPAVDKDTQLDLLEETADQKLEDELKSIESIDSSFLEIEDFAFDQSINMNMWKLSIPLIEKRRRFQTGKIYYVYILTVERNDDKSNSSTNSERGSREDKKTLESRSLANQPAQISSLSPEESDDDDLEEQQIKEFEAMSQLPKAWSIARTYDEFYVFDRRLRNQFGTNSQPFALLPDRKMMCPRTQKFLESQRSHMEAFLQQLTRQQNLKHCELFFAFLTNPGESGFESSLIATDDLNTTNTVSQRRKMMESDDGEYLKPFISRLLAKALTNDEVYNMGVPEEPGKFETNSLDSGTYSLLPDAASDEARDQFIPFKLSLKNPHLSYPKKVLEGVETPSVEQVLAIQTFHKLQGNVTSMAAYLLNLMLLPHECLKVLALTLVDLFSHTLNKLFKQVLKKTANTVLDENTVLYIVNVLHDVVFDEHREQMSQEEIQQRAVSAEKLLDEWLRPQMLSKLSTTAAERTQTTIHRVFQCFQHTTLNRQLAFVLADKLVQKILPPDPDKILHQLYSDLDNNK